MHINDIINSLIIGLINVIITMHFSPISLHVIMYHEEIMNRVSEFAIRYLCQNAIVSPAKDFIKSISHFLASTPLQQTLVKDFQLVHI